MYCWRELTADGDGSEHGDLEPLMLRPRSDNPAMGWVVLQTVGALVVIFAASHLFVGQIEAVGPWLGLSPQLTALLFSPIATELPEIMNAVIWVRQGKERLALANISGAMMIQATIPTAFGLFFTPWHLASPSILAAVMTAIAIVFLQFVFRARRVSSRLLTCVGGFYAGVRRAAAGDLSKPPGGKAAARRRGGGRATRRAGPATTQSCRRAARPPRLFDHPARQAMSSAQAEFEASALQVGLDGARAQVQLVADRRQRVAGQVQQADLLLAQRQRDVLLVEARSKALRQRVGALAG